MSKMKKDSRKITIVVLVFVFAYLFFNFTYGLVNYGNGTYMMTNMHYFGSIFNLLLIVILALVIFWLIKNTNSK